ncbi:T9SS type A sorting domain-containing protein [Segetibacter koreensis]|uniref:T9SS type A sorting domain-containing protein n=1 Tax=Segetibacter koreensis TaxID=398037 RepID=UPI0003653BFF|nr:T9SS type A sorting domain-containing protein [Segetibacter koreensis]
MVFFKTGLVASYTLGTITPATPTITAAKVNGLANEQTLAQRLTIKARPNPSANYFTLSLSDAGNNPVAMRVSDALGKLIEIKANVAANTGIYYLQVMQG